MNVCCPCASNAAANEGRLVAAPLPPPVAFFPLLVPIALPLPLPSLVTSGTHTPLAISTMLFVLAAGRGAAAAAEPLSLAASIVVAVLSSPSACAGAAGGGGGRLTSPAASAAICRSTWSGKLCVCILVSLCSTFPPPFFLAAAAFLASFRDGLLIPGAEADLENVASDARRGATLAIL